MSAADGVAQLTAAVEAAGGRTAAIAGRSPLGRLGNPADAASSVAFPCSERGGWVNGQLIQSDGGIHT